MSGTSLDGIDAALVALPAQAAAPQLVATHYRPYASHLKTALLALHQPGHDELHRAAVLGNELAREYALATRTLLQTANVPPQQVRAIGCHGQTVRHRPDQGYTLQLNNPTLLAELTGIDVVGDFRNRDIAAGGQGAPLVPAFHDQVARHPTAHRVIVNIGGISNLTDLPPQRTATGFDCGPGNMLMDAWINKHRGEEYDKNGAWAAAGRIIPSLLQTLQQEPFLHAPPPKSSGRDLFNLDWLENRLSGLESAVDVQATLLAFSALAIADAIKQFCPGTEEAYLCGGGAHNQALFLQLQAALPGIRIALTDELGIAADWMEAMAFAWLARQTVHGYRLDLTSVTGARHPCVLGAIYQA